LAAAWNVTAGVASQLLLDGAPDLPGPDLPGPGPGPDRAGAAPAGDDLQAARRRLLGAPPAPPADPEDDA
jgi:hypothetical protein